MSLKSHPFTAYGSSITTNLQLGDYLCAEDQSRYRLTASEVLPDDSVEIPSGKHALPTSHGRKLTLFTEGSLAESVDGKPWCFEVEGIARFCWAGGDKTVRYQRLEQCTDVLLAFWLIHIVLPLFMTLEDLYEFIHASSVTVGDRTLLFTAPSHGGKSTLTDFFLQQGSTLVSDDKVATYAENERYFAVPSHPNHRPYRQFEDLGYRVDRFDPQPRPIDAIYSLQGVDPDSDIAIEKVSGHGKFSCVRPSYLFEFKFLQEKRLEYLARLLSVVPVCRVGIPWNVDRLPAVHDTISKHCLCT